MSLDKKKLHKILPHIPKKCRHGLNILLTPVGLRKSFQLCLPRQTTFREFTRNSPGGGGENRGVQLSEMEKMSIVNSLIRPTSKTHHPSSKSGGWNHHCQVNWKLTHFFIRDCCWRSPNRSLYRISGHVWDPHFLKMFEKKNMTSSQTLTGCFLSPPFFPDCFFSPFWNVFEFVPWKNPMEICTFQFEIHFKVQINLRNTPPKSNRLNNLKTTLFCKEKSSSRSPF